MKPPNNKSAYTKTLKSYKNTEILTANKEHILLLLYEGAIRFLKQAIQETEKKNISEKSRFIGRAQDIINELRATLDHKQGGELSQSLDLLYDFITNRLVAATQETGTEKLHEALSILLTLQEAWQSAITSLKTEKKAA